ncbi:MAG: hypothetical protein ACREF8_03435 [Chthoniobacterales bacterium]
MASKVPLTAMLCLFARALLAQTAVPPFSPLYWDYYEQIKPAGAP